MIRRLLFWSYGCKCCICLLSMAAIAHCFAQRAVSVQDKVSNAQASGDSPLRSAGDDSDEANRAGSDSSTAESSSQGDGRSLNRELEWKAAEEQSLSARQIFGILQSQPDSIVELKALMAELAQQQGKALQDDLISDEMLYDRISSSPELRANVTTFLRARGYVSNNEYDFKREGYENSVSNSGSAESWEMTNTRPELYHSQETLDGVPAGSRKQRFVTESTNASRYDISENTKNWNKPMSSKSAMLESSPLRKPTPYNLLSLRDLYTQLPDESGQLKRFGSDVFLRREAAGESRAALESLDVPVGPDYVVGPGDALVINMSGGISQSVTREIDREGRITLPETAGVQVAGLTLAQASNAITDALHLQFRDERVSATVSRLRSIRVYVVGDVQRPGAYQISSLATSLNALYAAGGPTNTGSLRELKHYRRSELVGEIDLYDFLLHGVQSEDRLQSGDTVLVPPAGPQVWVVGAVKRPAIYELKTGDSFRANTLASVLEDAGGFTAWADLSHTVIDRIDKNHHRETISLRIGETAAQEGDSLHFPMQDGDRVKISPIAPYSLRVVYLDGHVLRPGRTPYRDGMHLSDVIQSYQDVLPEPADKGEIVRLRPPDLHPETMEFSVPGVLMGNENPVLQPFDTVRVYGRYEADAPRVTVGGEVLRPGTYALSMDMTAAQLVRAAGGFKRDALLANADLTSYATSGGNSVISQRTSIRIGDAVLRADASADVPLKAGDVLTVHPITGWNDIGSSIRLEGEVAHPGSYGIQLGERLSSILRRAGGMRDTGYPEGAVFLREEVRKLEEKSREELIRQIETSSAAARLRPSLGTSDASATMQQIAQQQEEILARLKSQPASGRLVIRISSDIASWENTPADIEVRAGDILRIPKRPGFVLVSGQVYNASAITFTPDKNAGWYLRNAGGATTVANTKEIFIIRANGSVIGHRSGTLFEHDVLGTRLDPGDVVVVPQKIIGASLFWRNLLTVGQIASSVAITAAVGGLL